MTSALPSLQLTKTLTINDLNNMNKYFQPFCFGLITIATLTNWQSVQAAAFGVYEPRGFAMGNTGVASAHPEQAAFYNPALMGFNKGHERDTEAGRFILPNTAVLVSRDIIDIVDAIDDELPLIDERIALAVDVFNNGINGVVDQENDSIELLDSIDQLDNIFDLIGDGTIVIDNFFGVVASEPSDKEGGAFYFGVRGIARGVARNTDDDRELAQRYRETISFIANGGNVNEAPNQDLLVNGDLVDPIDVVASTADISSLILTEAGIAVGKEFDIFGHKISLGITPKVAYVRAYRQSFQYGAEDQDIDYQGIVKDFFTLNADLGIAYRWGEKVRLGLAVKDLVVKDFELDNGLSVQLVPKVRFGSAYELDTMTFAFDIDLYASEPIGDELNSQELALGWEWRIKSWALRAGYQQDIRSDLDGIFTTGVGLRWGNINTDISVALSQQNFGFGSQFAYIF